MNNFSKIFIFSSVLFFNISLSVGWGDILPSKLPNPPQVKVELDLPAKQPVRPPSICDPSIRKLILSSSSHHNHRVEIEVKLQPKPSWTSENFRDYFAQQLKNEVAIFKNNDGTYSCRFSAKAQDYIFNQYELYVHPGFRDFVQTLDNFGPLIIKFRNQGFPSMCKLNAQYDKLPEVSELFHGGKNSFCSLMCDWFPHPCYMSDIDTTAANTAKQAPQLIPEVQNTLQDPTAPAALKDACERRLDALNSTVLNNGVLSIVKLELSSAVQEVAERYGIDLARLQLSCGSDIMHVLNIESLDIIQEAQQLNGCILKFDVEQCALTSKNYTEQGNIGNAMAFADICHVTIDHIKKFGMVLAECTQGVGLGAYDAVVNTAHMLRHPVKTAQEVITGMSTVASYISKVMLRMGYIHELTSIDPEAGYKEQLRFTHEVKQITNAVTEVLNETYAAMSMRDIVRHGTSFLVESCLTGKAISTLGSLSSKAVMLSRIAAGSIKNIVRDSELLEPIAAGVGKVEELSSKTGMLFNEIEGQAGKVGTVESQLGKVVEQETKQLASQITQVTEAATEWWETYQNKWTGNVIKEFNTQKLPMKKIAEHTFSKEHCKNGIERLAPTRKEACDLMIQKIRQADSMNLIKNNMNNQIRTVVNGIQLEIRVFVRDNGALMFNGFVGAYPNTNYGNIIHL